MLKDERVLLLVNETSGNGRGKKLFDELSSGSTPFGVTDSWKKMKTTAGDEWKTQFRRELVDAETVCVVGGDGTLMEAVQVMNEFPGKSLLPIPAGRGNDFVRALYGYTGEEEYWQWLQGKTSEHAWTKRPLDLATANGKVFLNMASLGYGGRVVEKTHHRNAFWSKTAAVYQVEGALALFEAKEIFCKITIDGSAAYEGKMFGAFVSNGKANGSGLFWNPKAECDDGKLDAIVFTKPGVLEMLRSLNAVKRKEEPCFKYKRYQAKEILFEYESPAALELDGDFSGNAIKHGFICLPQILNVWILYTH